MNNILFTHKLNMDKTKNFVSQLEKAKAEKIKEQEISQNVKLVYDFIVKLIIFFVQNAVFYSAYHVLSNKISLLSFNYLEFLSLHLATYTGLFILRNLFRPFTN
jgi:hypothetical protein